MDKIALISQVKNEAQASDTFVAQKRLQYWQRIQKYDAQKKEKGKINIHMIANTIDSLIAVSFTDGLTQKFIPRDGWIGWEKADKLNYVAKFDANSAHYQQIKYQMEQDRLFFGVGIRMLQNFDEVNMQPKRTVINPLSWYPDPLPIENGAFDGQNQRYSGFKIQTSYYDLKNNLIGEKGGMQTGFVDGEGLVNLAMLQNKVSKDFMLQKNAEAVRGNYIIPVLESITENFYCEVYYHFTWFNGKKYMVMTDTSWQIFLGAKEIKPVLESEQKNASNIPWPFVINYYEPLRGDAFGKSICDRLEDKQDAKSILFNLSIIKAKKEALGGDFLVNSRLIKNRQELVKPATDSRYITVDNLQAGDSLSNAMYEVPRSQVKQDIYNWINLLEKETTLDTGIDALQQGIVADRSITATESQTVQANANLKNILKNNINAWGERMFWKLWYREYVSKFSQVDEKFIALKNNFEWSTFSLKRTDFIGSEDIHIEVGTKADIEAQDKQLLLQMQLERPQFMASQAKEVSKRFFMRHLYRLMGWDENSVMLYVDLTPYERKAKSVIDIINLDVLPKSAFTNVDPEYIYTLWVYLQKAEENKTKKAMVETLQMIMLDEGITSSVNPMQGQGQEVANQASGVQMGKAVNQPQGALSRGDSLQPNVMQNA